MENLGNPAKCLKFTKNFNKLIIKRAAKDINLEQTLRKLKIIYFSNIKFLEISGVDEDLVEFGTLAFFIRVIKQIQIIHIDGCKLSTEKAKSVEINELSRSIKLNTTITEFKYKNTPPNKKLSKILYESFTQHPNILNLELEEEDIEQNFPSIINLIKGAPKLQKIYISPRWKEMEMLHLAQILSTMELEIEVIEGAIMKEYCDTGGRAKIRDKYINFLQVIRSRTLRDINISDIMGRIGSSSAMVPIPTIIFNNCPKLNVVNFLNPYFIFSADHLARVPQGRLIEVVLNVHILDWMEVRKFFEDNEQLISIDFRYEYLKGRKDDMETQDKRILIQEAMKALKDMRKIEEIILRGGNSKNYTVNYLFPILEAIKPFQKLKTILLAGNYFVEEYFIDVINTLLKVNSIDTYRNLVIHNNDLDENFIEVNGFIAKTATKILVSLLERSKCLQEVYITGLMNFNSKILGAGLTSNSIQFLTLEFLNISNAAIIGLMKGLKDNKVLKLIDLGYKKVTYIEKEKTDKILPHFLELLTEGGSHLTEIVLDVYPTERDRDFLIKKLEDKEDWIHRHPQLVYMMVNVNKTRKQLTESPYAMKTRYRDFRYKGKYYEVYIHNQY